MATQQEIRDLKEYWVNTFYSTLRKEQKTDDSFYKDTFPVSTLIQPTRIQRTGRASRLIDSPAEHIIRSQPLVIRKPQKDTTSSKLSALAVSAEVNRWANVYRRSNPNPYRQFLKNLLLRGEAWFQVEHNERWVTGKKDRQGSPIHLLTPDPMIVYGDPENETNGIPERVIIYYTGKVSSFLFRFPQWVNPKNRANTEDSLVEFLMYIDADQVFMEIDEQVMLDRKNIYGCMNFVHALSGFGTTSPEGLPEDMIVGRLRKSRDRLIRDCAIVSDIDSTFHLFANRNFDVQPIDDAHEIPDNFAQEYVMGKGLIHELPYGITVTKSEELLPEPQMFQYYRDIVSEFEMEDPLVLSGAIMGTSGRQQGGALSAALLRYETVIENTEFSAATALGIGLKICEKVPTLCPNEYGMTKKDIGGNYDLTVHLKAEDPVARSIRATEGSRLYQQGELDLLTNLTQYQGQSQEEANEIMVNILVDRVTFQSPEVAELMGLKLAEKAGLLEQLQLLKQRRSQLEKSPQGLMPSPTSSEMKQRVGETETPLGMEMMDMAVTKPSRQPPISYTRG